MTYSGQPPTAVWESIIPLFSPLTPSPVISTSPLASLTIRSSTSSLTGSIAPAYFNTESYSFRLYAREDLDFCTSPIITIEVENDILIELVMSYPICNINKNDV